jgi:putative sigma-54 modulation protein
MRIETYGQQLEVTPAMRDYLESKLQRLERYAGAPFEVRAQFAISKPDHRIEATISMPGRTLHADAHAPTMYAAIDLLSHKLDRMLVKHKEKLHDHSTPGLRENIA